MRSYQETDIISRLEKRAGVDFWALFAKRDFQKRETIYCLNPDDPRAEMVPFQDSFTEWCMEYSITIAACAGETEDKFVFCPQLDHPFRMTNHSCEANIGLASYGRLFPGEGVRIVALRDIVSGEELTIDYPSITPNGDGSLAGEAWQMAECWCGKPSCRRYISDFVHLPWELQKQAIQNGTVIAHILQADQFKELLAELSNKQYDDYEAALRSQCELSMKLRE